MVADAVVLRENTSEIMNVMGEAIAEIRTQVGPLSASARAGALRWPVESRCTRRLHHVQARAGLAASAGRTDRPVSPPPAH